MQYKWTVLTVTTVGVLMAGIDSRILVIGLPQIATAMHADAEQAVWFTQGYALASTVMLLLIGRITDIFGRVKLYNAGFVIFTIGSLLTSLSTSPEQMIAFRIMQGLGSSMIWSNSIAMITDATPKNELGFSLGVNAIAYNLGSVLGLTVSGLILFFFDWRFLFYVNIPIGIFGTVWARLRLREIATTERGASIDWVGFGTFVVSITSFLLALSYAVYGLAEATTVDYLLVLSAVAIAAFLAWERRCRYPLLDLALLRIRAFGGSVAALAITVTAFSSLALLLSLFFQLELGLSPLEAGLRLVPLDLTAVLMAPVSGKLSDRFGQGGFVIGGLALTSVTTYLFSTVDPSTPYIYSLFYMVLLGVGISVFLAPNASLCMAAVPALRRGVAASVRSTFWNVGFTISLNLVLWIMTFKAPYQVITALISSIGPVGNLAVDRASFMEGLKTAYLWLAALNAAALIPTIAGLTSKKTKL